MMYSVTCIAFCKCQNIELLILSLHIILFLLPPWKLTPCFRYCNKSDVMLWRLICLFTLVPVALRILPGSCCLTQLLFIFTTSPFLTQSDDNVTCMAKIYLDHSLRILGMAPQIKHHLWRSLKRTWILRPLCIRDAQWMPQIVPQTRKRTMWL